MISILTWNCLAPPTLMLFAIDRSVSVWTGVRTSVMTRGALPNVFPGAVLKAAGFSHAADGWSADARRSSWFPGVLSGTPGTRFGRWPLPSRLLVELLCETPIG